MLFNLVLTSFRTMNSIEVACYLCLSSNIALLKTCLSHPPVITACVTRDVPDTCLYPGCMRAYRYKLPEAAAVVAPLPRQPQPQARTLSVINEDHDSVSRVEGIVEGSGLSGCIRKYGLGRFSASSSSIKTLRAPPTPRGGSGGSTSSGGTGGTSSGGTGGTSRGGGSTSRGGGSTGSGGGSTGSGGSTGAKAEPKPGLFTLPLLCASLLVRGCTLVTRNTAMPETTPPQRWR